MSELTDGTVLFTRYVDGPDGNVASFTVEGSADALAWRGGERPSGIAAFFKSIVSARTGPGATDFSGLLFVAQAAMVLTFFVGICAWLFRKRLVLVRRDATLSVFVPALALCLFTSFVVSPLSLSGQDFTPGANGAGIPVAGETLYFHHDQVGSTSLVTDVAGALHSRVGYLPYGQIFEQESSGTDSFRAKFTGHEWSYGAGLYLAGARQYDPLTGRFTGADRNFIGAEENSIAAFNRYAYAANNPIVYTDPTGEEAVTTIIIAIVAAIVGAYTGMALANGTLNPAKWDFSAPETWIGMVAGIAIAEIGLAVAIGVAAAIPPAMGVAGQIVGGVAGGLVTGALQGVTNAALSGQGILDILRAGISGALTGALLGGLMAGVGAGLGSLANSLDDSLSSLTTSLSKGAKSIINSVKSKAGKLGFGGGGGKGTGMFSQASKFVKQGVSAFKTKASAAVSKVKGLFPKGNGKPSAISQKMGKARDTVLGGIRDTTKKFLSSPPSRLFLEKTVGKGFYKYPETFVTPGKMSAFNYKPSGLLLDAIEEKVMGSSSSSGQTDSGAPPPVTTINVAPETVGGALLPYPTGMSSLVGALQ